MNAAAAQPGHAASRPRRCFALLRWATGLALAVTLAGAGCDEPNVVPPPPVELPPDSITLPPGAAPAPGEVPNPDPNSTATRPTVPYDRRLLWHYSRLMDAEIVTSFAGESDMLNDLSLLVPDNPQRVATLDLLYANWNHMPRPTAHVRIALLRLVATLAPGDPRTTQVLIAALEDSAMKVRFRANNFLKDIYATDVDYDPNGADAPPRAAAIARWKRVVQAAHPATPPPAPAAVPPVTTPAPAPTNAAP